MRQQPSKKAIELRLEWINKALGKPTALFDGKRMTDAFYVDHCLGGYRLETGGGQVFGHQRMTKTQLVDQMEAILVAIKLARNENTGSALPTFAPTGETIRPDEKPDCYQPKTGAKCSCRPGIERDNCAKCEGTGMVIDFAAIRARR